MQLDKKSLAKSQISQREAIRKEVDDKMCMHEESKKVSTETMFLGV